ncbi:hypothetical protein O0555_15635 [Brevibacillus laterosporus]|uniref:hypothetical protein n=1 Tax=Brevibacillus laterosporus TaxID=1465 RepID=UPI00215CF74C|nr:hypothetical protein [Brevibacillus laterosporus]MCR8938765.1 hypothetical protein [Brevibacillus laterosporus]MCZ0841405.1 hypothetical protein [Brevibacillus laterosporus]MCZ0847729.1 hypothetical protein [Brevibacillus laterosporus]
MTLFYEIAFRASICLVMVLGIGVLLMAVCYVYDKIFSWLLTYFNIKRDLIQFMREKRRRPTFKPSLKRMSDEEVAELKDELTRKGAEK